MNNRAPKWKFMTIIDGELELQEWDGTTIARGVQAVSKALQPDERAACSSTLNFPEEYTTDKATIAVCNSIRGRMR